MLIQSNHIISKIQLLSQVYLSMARTKQTARKTCFGKAPRSRVGGKGMTGHVRKSGPSGGMMAQQQEIPDIVNTQQFSLNFDDQEECEKGALKANIHKCSRCDAYFTSQSTLITHDAYHAKKSDPDLTDIDKQKFLNKFENVWICQFCLKHNSIPKIYKPPISPNPCLILADAKKDDKGNAINEQKMLIFCIDISGSMDFVFSGKSRLESVKQAIIDEINRLKFEKEKIKIGIITFGSYVNLVGDGKAFKQSILKTDLYKNFDGICEQLLGVKNFCFPIEKSYSSLKKTIQGLTTYGSTALGPGLLSAVQLASQGPVGSKVILCTDGEANVGLGGSFNDDRFTFYSKMAEHAKKRNVMVNILSLKGDRCNLKQLGKLSLATEGSILKIDPAFLGTQFNKIIKENILGSGSKLIVKVNKVFRICNGSQDELSKDKTTLKQDFGNFSAQTILSFQFETILKEEAVKNPEIDIGLYSQKRVPMQIQLEYTGRKGQRYLQVITDWRQVTENFDDIYDGADFGLFAISVLQRASQKIKNEQYEAASVILRGYQSLVEEKFKKTEDQENIERFNQRIKALERVLNSKMRKNNIKSERDPGTMSRGGGRGRGKGGVRSKTKKSASRGHLPQEQEQNMASDSEEEILYQEIRARDKDKKQRPARKEKSVQKSIERQRSRNKTKATRSRRS